MPELRQPRRGVGDEPQEELAFELGLGRLGRPFGFVQENVTVVVRLIVMSRSHARTLRAIRRHWIADWPPAQPVTGDGVAPRGSAARQQYQATMLR